MHWPLQNVVCHTETQICPPCAFTPVLYLPVSICEQTQDRLQYQVSTGYWMKNSFSFFFGGVVSLSSSFICFPHWDLQYHVFHHVSLFYTVTSTPHSQTSCTVSTLAFAPRPELGSQIEFQIKHSRAFSPLSNTHTQHFHSMSSWTAHAHKKMCCLLAQGLYGDGVDYCGHQGEKSWQVWKSHL